MISLICSDLHGDGKAAERLEALINFYHPDRILLLGDLFSAGMRFGLPLSYDPEKTWKVLSRHANKILAVRGNCDRMEEIRSSPFECPESRHLRQGDHLLFLLHDERYLDFPLSPGDILLTGHTHQSKLVSSGGVIYANPGSLAWPRDNQGPTFILCEDHRITLLKEDRSVVASLTL